MPGFRRAQLRGSEELFRSTDSQTTEATQEEIEVGVNGVSPGAAAVSPVPNAPAHGHRSVRLDVADIEMILDGLQQLKFPKTQPRPSVEDFERIEALRKQLLEQI
jgi:hypothetical protein